MEFPICIPFENEWWTFTILLVLIFIFVWASEIILKFNWLSPESNRRLMHISIGLLITTSPLFFLNNIQPACLALIFIIVNIFALQYDIFKGIHSQNRQTYGTIYFPIAYFILSIGFWEYPELIMISLLILTLSDPFASISGEYASKNNIFIIWKDQKSIQGTLTFFFITFTLIYISAKYFYNYSTIYLLLLSGFTAIGSTISEITSSKGSDNLSIPITTFLFMLCFFEFINPSQNIIHYDILLNKSLILILLSTLFYIAYRLESLNLSGFFGCLIMGIIIAIMGSYRYLIPLSVFFILSSFLSKVLKNKSFYQNKGSKRDIIQVYANGGVSLCICVMDYLHNEPILFFLFLSSVAAAMSDTWGTEFGKLSKKKPISIVSFKPIQHGLSGGITRIGTIGSFLGSSIIGLTSWLLIPIPSKIIYGIILSGFIAALFDSIIGATIQGKYETKNGDLIEVKSDSANLITGFKWIDNDIVNYMNTIIAPIIMYLFLHLI
ncbi:MAG: DUF92 domain-containing protein [Candidatus Neomarinimicrobiota bacterium]